MGINELAATLAVLVAFPLVLSVSIYFMPQGV